MLTIDDDANITVTRKTSFPYYSPDLTILAAHSSTAFSTIAVKSNGWNL